MNFKFQVGEFVYGPFGVSGKITERVFIHELNKYKIEGHNVTYLEGELSSKKPSVFKKIIGRP